MFFKLAGQKQTIIIQYKYKSLVFTQLIMIQSSKPNYRIKYRDCADKNHQGQKLNFVCLNQKCCENSLICSICREDTHKGHSIQPLKFYIQSLKQEYQNDKINYEKQFESLQTSRAIFLIKLRQSVQRVAEEFRKLEEQIMQRFDLLKNQIIENQSKKNKFPQFYQSLTKETEDNPQFLIRNYLPSKKTQALENVDPIQQLGKKLSTVIYELRESIFTAQSKKQQTIQTNLKFQQQLASTVTHLGTFYTQNNHVATNQLTMSAIAADLVKNFQNLKIKIKITKLKKGAQIYLGAIEKQFFKSLNNKPPANWNLATNTGKLYYFSSLGVVFGQTVSQLKNFGQNSNLQVTMNGNIMKMGMKKNSAQFTLLNTNQYYFFFNLLGQAQIQLVYVKK